MREGHATNYDSLGQVSKNRSYHIHMKPLLACLVLLLLIDGGDAAKKKKKKADASMVPAGSRGRSKESQNKNGPGFGEPVMTPDVDMFFGALPATTRPHPVASDSCVASLAGQFDVDKNGVIEREEIAEVLPGMTSPEDAKEGTPEEKVEGMMMMLDDDGNGVGTREEMKLFMKKMQEMDGRLDRLPTPAAKRPQSKPKKREGSYSHWSEHDEL